MPAPVLPSGFVFSQSSFQDYNDCPRRFQLRYLDKLQWPAVEIEPALENERRQQEGQLFHRLVQQQIIGIPVEKLTLQASSQDLRHWWENYCAHPVSVSGYKQHAEVTFSAPLGEKYRLLAKYDLILLKPGKEALIYDWKTYARRPRDETMAARWQTRVYRALLILAGAQLNGGNSILPEHLTMIYWYASYPSEPAKFPYTPVLFKRDCDALNKLVEEISTASDFPKTEDERKCAWCVYRSYCERKTPAGSGEALEAELTEPEINLEQIQEVAF